MTAQKKIIKHLYKNQLGINNSNYHLPSFKTFLLSDSIESFQDVVSNGNMFYLDNGLSSVETLNFFIPPQWVCYNKRLWFKTWMWGKTIFLVFFSVLSKWLVQMLLLLFEAGKGCLLCVKNLWFKVQSTVAFPDVMLSRYILNRMKMSLKRSLNEVTNMRDRL